MGNAARYGTVPDERTVKIVPTVSGVRQHNSVEAVKAMEVVGGKFGGNLTRNRPSVAALNETLAHPKPSTHTGVNALLCRRMGMEVEVEDIDMRKRHLWERTEEIILIICCLRYLSIMEPDVLTNWSNY